MKNNEDRLDVLKAKYLKQIDAKQDEIAAIRQKLLVLDELKAEADNLELPELPISIPRKVLGADLSEHAFAATGLTDSVIKSVSWFGTKAFRPPDMRKHLLEHGFKPTGKNFGVSVGTTLKRLAARGKILCEDLNGKTVYRAKP